LAAPYLESIYSDALPLGSGQLHSSKLVTIIDWSTIHKTNEEKKPLSRPNAGSQIQAKAQKKTPPLGRLWAAYSPPPPPGFLHE
jgi:hypothetical protein